MSMVSRFQEVVCSVQSQSCEIEMLMVALLREIVRVCPVHFASCCIWLRKANCVLRMHCVAGCTCLLLVALVCVSVCFVSMKGNLVMTGTDFNRMFVLDAVCKCITVSSNGLFVIGVCAHAVYCSLVFACSVCLPYSKYVCMTVAQCTDGFSTLGDDVKPL